MPDGSYTLTEAEKVCLECTLPICDDTSKDCRFVQITYIWPRYQPQKEAALAELDGRLAGYIADGSNAEWIDNFYRAALDRYHIRI